MVEFSPPWNFSWVIENKIAAMGWPQTPSNMNYLIQQGIKHLVTLSPEMKPPVSKFNGQIGWSLIAIEEFEPPTLEDMIKFIQICEECEAKNQAIGVHCRMGRGRTGVMVACYLVHFQGITPERAITNLRLLRPGSVETKGQERAVSLYHDYLRRK